MHIVLLVDPEIPVPPRLYGGIERVVDALVRGLLARGHRVTLFAHPESQVDCELQGWRGGASQSRSDTLRNMAQLTAFVARLSERPVIHSFARLAYSLLLLPGRVPVVQTYERAISPRSVVLGHVISRGRMRFTACSAACAATGNVVGHWDVVYNCVDLERYDFVPRVASDAPLMFLGRVERIKGAHHAIEIARRTGRRLIIAGNCPERGPDVEYARAIVARCDGDRLRYAGPVDDRAKNALLGSAACLLMPIEWEEPFGIVMAEALACGTPVLGFRRGSVPEVVAHGVSGFVCDDLEDLVRAVSRIGELQRSDCRRAAETRFSREVIVAEYERVYRALL